MPEQLTKHPEVTLHVLQKAAPGAPAARPTLRDQDAKAKATASRMAALGLANTTATAAGLKVPDVVLARYKMAIDDMARQMDHDCGNLSLVLQRYAMHCKAIMENPDRTLLGFFNEAQRKATSSPRKAMPAPPVAR